MDLNRVAREARAPDVTSFEQHCSLDWPLRDGTLDAVFSSNFFEHLPATPTLEKRFQEAARCREVAFRNPLKNLAPQVGFEPTTLRLTADTVIAASFCKYKT